MKHSRTFTNADLAMIFIEEQGLTDYRFKADLTEQGVTVFIVTWEEPFLSNEKILKLFGHGFIGEQKIARKFHKEEES